MKAMVVGAPRTPLRLTEMDIPEPGAGDVRVYCRSGRENLCDLARFTGYDIDGGYAEYAVADARYCFRIDATYSDVQAAPLLCAGLIGYRALTMTGGVFRLRRHGFRS